MIAMLFMAEERTAQHDAEPLLSCADIVALLKHFLPQAAINRTTSWHRCAYDTDSVRRPSIPHTRSRPGAWSDHAKFPGPLAQEESDKVK